MIFLVLICIKLALNLNKLFRTRFMLKKYQKYTSDPNWKFTESIPEIIKLLKSAGISDSQVTYIEPIGYGKIQSGLVSAFDNLGNTRADVVTLFNSKLHQAIGVYRSRAIETINPIYWLEFIITLPKQVLSFLGIPPEATLSKIAQILYWLISVLLSLAYAIFKEEIHQYIRDLLL